MPLVQPKAFFEVFKPCVFFMILRYNACAALMTNSVILFGCDNMGTWPEFSSIVFAFISFALNLSRSGLITISCPATTYQDGFVFHAGFCTFSVPADAANGTCVA